MSAPNSKSPINQSAPEPPKVQPSIPEYPKVESLSPNSPENRDPEDPNSPQHGGEEGGDAAAEVKEATEEEEECGFCLFMKGGGCKEQFTAWEKCMDEAEKEKEDVVEKCVEVTMMLKKCMEANRDYYAPVLRAEAAAEEEAIKALKQQAGEVAVEAAKSGEGSATDSSKVDQSSSQCG